MNMALDGASREEIEGHLAEHYSSMTPARSSTTCSRWRASSASAEGAAAGPGAD